jgi:hypothetical protein
MASPEWATTSCPVGKMFFEARQKQTAMYGGMIMKHF